MREILFSYLFFNVLAGVVLTPIQLIRSKGKTEPLNVIFLLLFPAIGLGKWIYARTIAANDTPEYPEQWFIYRYMVKVNWVYLILITAMPVIVIVLATFGTALLGLIGMNMNDFGAYSEVLSFLEAGIILAILLYLVVALFVMAIPYLILIYLPTHQYKTIEKRVLLQKIQTTDQAKNSMPPKNPIHGKPVKLFNDIESYMKQCEAETATIPKERRKVLESFADYIREKLNSGNTANLIFVCTHNSRRSQFAQIWAATASSYFGIQSVYAFSGGTEETAFSKRAVAALQRVGFKIDGTVGTNPRYSVRFSDETGALDCYSKKFEHPANPQKGFAAIMTCEEADSNCPVVLGSDYRVQLSYDDPKISDRTELESVTYDERCKQIATELVYLFSKV